MKLNKLITLLLITMVLTAFFVYTIYETFFILERREIPMDVNVTSENKVGFNLDKDAMHFGKIPLGGGGQRYIIFENNIEKDVEVVLYTSGEISGLIEIPENRFVLEPKEAKRIIIKVQIMDNTVVKDYTGKLIIEIRRKF